MIKLKLQQLLLSACLFLGANHLNQAQENTEVGTKVTIIVAPRSDLPFYKKEKHKSLPFELYTGLYNEETDTVQFIYEVSQGLGCENILSTRTKKELFNEIEKVKIKLYLKNEKSGYTEIEEKEITLGILDVLEKHGIEIKEEANNQVVFFYAVIPQDPSPTLPSTD